MMPSDWRSILPCVMWLVAEQRWRKKQAASTSEVGRFETDILGTKENLTTLMNLSGRWIDTVHERKPLKTLILDMDSSVSETYGSQEGTAYNGHFECMCYHPLFLFNQDGDLERAMLRRGNHASAKFWRRVLLPVIDRYRHLDIPKFFRGDAAFANPAPLRNGRCTECWRKKVTFTPFVSKPTRSWSGKSNIFSPAPWGGLHASLRCSITASSIKPSHGSDRVAWWLRWSGIKMSCSREWGSS